MLFDNVFKNDGIAIIGVSVSVSFLCLPLYIVAEKWQETERQTQKCMAKAVTRIKAVFQGDEQYMMISALYKENRYHPLMALRSSFGLLIQIPFFIAAYSFLSHLSILEGQSFLCINDLSLPDKMFSVSSFSVNALPIAMTLINIAAAAVYTKGFKISEKAPVYIMAILFLLILYSSPSGLVLYWTMNNVFSLAKNIFYKIKHPLRVLYAMLCTVVILCDAYILFVHTGFFYKRVALAFALSLLLFAPVAFCIVRHLLKKQLKDLVPAPRYRFSLFMLSALSLALLFGAVLPSSVISSSTVEFCGIDKEGNPLCFVGVALLQSAGLFLFWPLCVYLLFGKRIQTLITAVFILSLLASLVDVFCFPFSSVTISRMMTFDSPLSSSVLPAVLNVFVLSFVVLFLLTLFDVNHRRILRGSIAIALIAEMSMALMSAIKINNGYKSYIIAAGKAFHSAASIEPIYHLSKTGKNVVVLMMDRAESAYLYSIFNSMPDVASSFDGFTFYPNTVSYNQGTLLGSPPLYGGYEYTPLEMNKRSSERLVDKHNEALLLMPRVFTEQAGFSATVADLSWANYKWIPDMSITSPFPKIEGRNAERCYTDIWVNEHPNRITPGLTSRAIKRNLVWFSLFRAVPIFFRDAVYNDGSWWSSDELTVDVMEFIDYYSALDYLPRLTAFDAKGDTFIAIANNTTHSGIDLMPPEYEPTSEKVTEECPVPYPSICGNVAMYRLVGRWLDLIDAQNCYDNTRIIIASDHGIGKDIAMTIAPYKGWPLEPDYCPDHNNPLLLVKDFGKRGKLETDRRFMTNADVPMLAFKDIILNPVNPWTGRQIISFEESDKKAVGVVLTRISSPGTNAYTFKVPENDWRTISDNIFDAANWQKGIQ